MFLVLFRNRKGSERGDRERYRKLPGPLYNEKHQTEGEGSHTCQAVP